MGSGTLPNPCRGVLLLSMCSDSCQGPCFDSGVGSPGRYGAKYVHGRWRPQVWRTHCLVWRRYGAQAPCRSTHFLYKIALPFLNYIWKPFSYRIWWVGSGTLVNPCGGTSIKLAPNRGLLEWV